MSVTPEDCMSYLILFLWMKKRSELSWSFLSTPSGKLFDQFEIMYDVQRISNLLMLMMQIRDEATALWITTGS